MISPVNFSEKSTQLLRARGLSDDQVSDFSALLANANDAMAASGDARQVLNNMSRDELALVQKAASLADRIDVSRLSAEGAQNLLAHPDRTGMVDLNSDGIVEIGIGKAIMFPPVNAPEYVSQAWEEATAGMSEGDKLLMEFHCHVMTFGIDLDGTPEEGVSMDAQWSQEGRTEWFAKARSALEFSVALDGWTRENLLERDFYNRFESALNKFA